MLARLAPAIFVLLWSTGWVVAKYAAVYADPLTFLVLRYTLAIALFILFCVVTGARWPKSWKMAGHAIVSGMFLHGLYLGSVWWAIGEGVPAGISGIIAGLQPLMTAVAAAFVIDERLSTQQKLGLVLGFFGIALAVLPKVLAIDTGATPILKNILPTTSAMHLPGLLMAWKYWSATARRDLQQRKNSGISGSRRRSVSRCAAAVPFSLSTISRPTSPKCPSIRRKLKQ
jgi:drug/metabolite transporter (DMT)-like permease